MKKIITLLLTVVIILTIGACTGNGLGSTEDKTISQSSVAFVVDNTTSSTQQTSVSLSTPIQIDYAADDLDSSESSDEMSFIRLEGDSISVEGDGVTVNNNLVTITAAGMYNISGTLNDGQILVDTLDAETVVLILDGVNINSTISSPIYINNAEKVVITLAEGTENIVTDRSTYTYDGDEDEPDATIFSKDDLTINGSGSLTVNANYNNGIACKDDLKIISGNITVNAPNDAIKGRDSVVIRDGTIYVESGADGIQSNNDEDTEKGYILIEGGKLTINSGLDGIQAETYLQINGGDIIITSGGGSTNNSTTGGGIWGGRGMEGNPNKPTESSKGLKAGIDITISSGTIHIDSADDSIHTNNSITINGGNILLASGDDGIHADSTLDINNGEINISQSYEGIESAIITINGGNIHLAASDDGINASGGVDGSSINGRPGQNEFNSGSCALYVNGGYIYVDARGDGIDINGTIEMSDGVVIVNGPTDNGNGPLDYLGTFNISGGYLVAVGSSGMAQAPSTSSTQYSVMYNFETLQGAGTLVHIETETGEEVLTFMPAKEYQSVLLSSSKLQNGTTYQVFSGGSSTGSVTDGVYTGGTYTAGTQLTSFTISSMVSALGATAGGFQGGPGGGRPARP